MRGVTITDRDESGRLLAIDLRDILRALVFETLSSQWRVRDVEAVGARAEELHRMADEANVVSGQALLELSTGIEQTIDGIFEAYRSGSGSPWLRVLAVDAAAFDVESSDTAVLDKIRKAFKKVTDLPT